MPEALCQRYRIRFYRNVFSDVPATKFREVANTLKAIHPQESRPAAQEKANTMIAGAVV